MKEPSAEYSKGSLSLLSTVAMGLRWQSWHSSDPLIVGVSLVSITAVVGFERFYLRGRRAEEDKRGA